MKPFKKRPKIGTLVKVPMPTEEFGKVIQHPKEKSIIAVRTELGLIVNLEWARCYKYKLKRAKTPTRAWQAWIRSKPGQKVTEGIDDSNRARLLAAFKAGWQRK